MIEVRMIYDMISGVKLEIEGGGKWLSEIVEDLIGCDGCCYDCGECDDEMEDVWFRFEWMVGVEWMKDNGVDVVYDSESECYGVGIDEWMSGGMRLELDRREIVVLMKMIKELRGRED